MQRIPNYTHQSWKEELVVYYIVLTSRRLSHTGRNTLTAIQLKANNQVQLKKLSVGLSQIVYLRQSTEFITISTQLLNHKQGINLTFPAL